MLVEVYDVDKPDKVAYMRGQVNDLQKDMLAARTEMKIYRPGMKPTELLAAVQKKYPRHSSLVCRHRWANQDKIEPEAMQFADEEVWEQLPKLTWEHILHFWQMFPVLGET
jgi:hypothetical protein